MKRAMWFVLAYRRGGIVLVMVVVDMILERSLAELRVKCVWGIRWTWFFKWLYYYKAMCKELLSSGMILLLLYISYAYRCSYN